MRAHAYFKHSKCPFSAASLARLLVPRTPVLVRVLQTLQMSIGRQSHVHSSQGHPFSCAYFKHPNVHSAASRTSACSKDTRSRARTSNSPSVHSRRHTRTSPRSKDTRARARTSNTPNVRAGRHSGTSPVPITPVLVRVLQHLQMSIPGGKRARRLVPRTPVLVRVLQTLQVSILGGTLARLLVPRTPVLVRVLQTLQMSILGGKLARPLVPRTPVLVRVLQTLQMSIPGGKRARRLVPRTPVLVRVLQTLQDVHSRRHHSHVSSYQSHPFSCAYFKHSKFPISWRQTRTSTRPTAPRARARTSYKPEPGMRVARVHGAAYSAKDSPLVVRFKIPATVANPVPIDAIASQIL